MPKQDMVRALVSIKRREWGLGKEVGGIQDVQAGFSRRARALLIR